MDQVRKGWSRDAKGFWWHHASRVKEGDCLKVLFTGVGEETLFGLPSEDESELQVAHVIQHATHLFFESSHDHDIPPRLRDWMTELGKLLETAWYPVPSLEYLIIEGKTTWVVPELDAKAPFGEIWTSQMLIDSGSRPSTLELLDGVCEAYANAISSGKLPSLKGLYLCDIAHGISGIEALGRAMESGGLKTLKVFDLTGTDLGGKDDSGRGHFILAKHMGTGRMRALESLCLSRTCMEGEDCEAYAQAIISRELPSLRIVDFSYNRIGNKGAEALRRAIRSGELKNLAELNLGCNNITDEGITSLANCFQGEEASILPKIRSISLWMNAFTDIGFQSLAEALKSGCLDSLENLDLIHDLIHWGQSTATEEGVSALVSAFSSNIHLTASVEFQWYEFPVLHRRVEQLRRRNFRKKDISGGLVDSPLVPATVGKVYLCGDPMTGKTTLCRTLRKNCWESMVMRKTRVEERTRGIDISEFSSQSSKKIENLITLQVWDIAGQEDYHVVQSAFFPDLGDAEGKATSFVIVCGSKNVEKDSQKHVDKPQNPREDSKQQVDYWLQQLVYWLKFIASSCGKSTDRRHVFVVLNNFYRELKESKYNQLWEQGLEILKEDFKDYLNIHTDPFILDVRKYSGVQPLKRRLLEHSRFLLKDAMIPDICQIMQKNLTHWCETREQFPVLRWKDFVDKVHQISEPWPVKTLEMATKYLNEAGVVIYIDKEPPPEWNLPHHKLVVLNPNWFCREIVGNMFLQQDMGNPTDFLFRMKVDKSTGSISESEFKKFFKLLLGSANELNDEDFGDLIAILLWLGLCYKGRGQKLFIPSLIAENITPWDHCESSDSRKHGEHEWVMGYSVEQSKSKVTLAPIALWHRFQVELAQTSRFNGHPDNGFVTGKYVMKFCADYMSVVIEVSVNYGSPTFNDISIFVKPLRKVGDLDKNRRQQCQVDLAGDLVDMLLGIWVEVCPGVEYLHRVVWPWPASQSRGEVLSERNVEVEQVRKWVQEHGLGRSMQWMVGSSTIKEDQLLTTKDKIAIAEKYEEVVLDTLHMLRQFEMESVEEGICTAHALTEEVPREALTMALDNTEITSLPGSSSHNLLLRELEAMGKTVNKMHKTVNQIALQLDHVEGLLREGFKEVLEKERELLNKLQDTGDFILQDRERICPRFIYLGQKDSGTWMTLKDAMSVKKFTRLHFLCEARFKDYRQHVVKNQKGLDLSGLKDWAKTIGPWLKVSLAVMFISAKVAANVVLPGVGLLLPSFTQWQQASSLSDAIALATAFSKDELNQHIVEGMGPDIHQNPRMLNGKSRKALSEFLGNLTIDEYEKKLALRKVRLRYDDGSHFVVWICRECFQKYASIKVVSELPI